jgi:hypothetical protein
MKPELTLSVAIDHRHCVKTFRDAGLECHWSRTATGAPCMVVRDPNGKLHHQRKVWWMVTKDLWNAMQKDGIKEAFHSFTLLGDIFYCSPITDNPRQVHAKVGFLPCPRHGNDESIYFLVCQRHGYLCDWNGTPKGYNWTRHIKAAFRFSSQAEAAKACTAIGLDPDSAVAEMHQKN